MLYILGPRNRSRDLSQIVHGSTWFKPRAWCWLWGTASPKTTDVQVRKQIRPRIDRKEKFDLSINDINSQSASIYLLSIPVIPFVDVRGTEQHAALSPHVAGESTRPASDSLSSWGSDEFYWNVPLQRSCDGLQQPGPWSLQSLWGWEGIDTSCVTMPEAFPVVVLAASFLKSMSWDWLTTSFAIYRVRYIQRCCNK